MAKTIGELLKWHFSQVGTKEKGRNNIIYNTHYYGREVNGSAYPWCCVYQWDGCRLTGMSDLFYNGRKTASCGTLWNWAKANGMVVPVTQAQSGDWVEFTFNGVKHAHIGIVVGKTVDGRYLYTVEGNTSSGSAGSQTDGEGVYFRKRPISQVFCIIRPRFQSAPIKQTYTTREITVWSAPAKLDDCRQKKIPMGYGVQVYDELIPSFTREGDYFYRTIKGAFVLAKYCV